MILVWHCRTQVPNFTQPPIDFGDLRGRSALGISFFSKSRSYTLPTWYYSHTLQSCGHNCFATVPHNSATRVFY